MKPVRILLLSIGVLVTALSVVVGLAFNSGVQTWAARKAMAAQPGLRGTLGAFSVGLERVELGEIGERGSSDHDARGCSLIIGIAT
jgi:hypothetical protein